MVKPSDGETKVPKSNVWDQAEVQENAERRRGTQQP